MQEDERETGFSDKLDLLKFVGDIHTRIKKDITADFIFAKLNDTDKEGVINMTVNAFSSKRLMYIYASKSEDDEAKILKEIGNSIFDNFMTKIYMTIILNRNVDGNYIIDVLSGYGNLAEEINVDAEKSKAKKLLENEEIKR